LGEKTDQISKFPKLPNREKAGEVLDEINKVKRIGEGIGFDDKHGWLELNGPCQQRYEDQLEKGLGPSTAARVDSIDERQSMARLRSG
jgi:hypothetical protein